VWGSGRPARLRTGSNLPPSGVTHTNKRPRDSAHSSQGAARTSDCNRGRAMTCRRLESVHLGPDQPPTPPWRINSGVSVPS